jgi:hypothetical protein
MFGILETIEPFKLLLALLPLVGYLFVLSLIRISGRALVTTGGRDIAALAMAISGLVAIGPIELFFPTAAATVFGPAVWVALAIFYALCSTLICLTCAQRLVVYGRTPEELYEPLLAAAREIDSQSVGDENLLQIRLPVAGFHVRLDGHRSLDHAQVIAFEPNVSPHIWSLLLVGLRKHLGTKTTPIPRRGFAMLTVVILMGLIVLWQSLGNRELVVEGFRDWLWR